MEYQVDYFYCAACDTLCCFFPHDSQEWITNCFINNTNWMEGKY
jgi:hypothetical protein